MGFPVVLMYSGLLATRVLLYGWITGQYKYRTSSGCAFEHLPVTDFNKQGFCQRRERKCDAKNSLLYPKPKNMWHLFFSLVSVRAVNRGNEKTADG